MNSSGSWNSCLRNLRRCSCLMKTRRRKNKTGWAGIAATTTPCPPQYVLRPRRVEYVPEASEEDRKAARKAEADQWWEIESTLHAILEEAAKQALEPQSDEFPKYVESATHQEIRRGASKANQPEDHVLCYFREIEGLPTDESAKEFCDLKGDTPDEDASERLKDLKKELSDALPEEHVHTYTATWDDGQAAHDLAQFCEDVKADLQRIIDDELDRFKQRSALEREQEAHRDFAKDRSEHFAGRTDVLGPDPGVSRIAGRQSTFDHPRQVRIGKDSPHRQSLARS